MHKSVFFLSKNGHEWSTHHGKHIFANQVVYPNFVSSTAGDVFDNGEDIWVLKAVEKANELGFRRIDISCGASIPTEQAERIGQTTHDLFRCHPSFHSYPYLRRSWHDWAMIHWAHDDPFLLGLLGAMRQKTKEKRQKTRRGKNMSEEKNIYQKEGRLHIIESY
jgi:hypothetical protein